MTFDFERLPGVPGAPPRPVLPVVLDGYARAPQLGLLDSGSLHNRFGAWFARWRGIDLSGAAEEVIAVGGFSTIARTVPVQMVVGDFRWTAPVSFCDPWPLDFHLLGQEGFFRWFKVTIRAAHFTVDLEPENA